MPGSNTSAFIRDCGTTGHRENNCDVFEIITTGFCPDVSSGRPKSTTWYARAFIKQANTL